MADHSLHNDSRGGFGTCFIVLLGWMFICRVVVFNTVAVLDVFERLERQPSDAFLWLILMEVSQQFEQT